MQFFPPSAGTEVEGVILNPSTFLETSRGAGKKQRNWCFTSFRGPIEWRDNMTYLLQGQEICPNTGNLHIQGFVVWKNARYMHGIVNDYRILGIHWAPCRGTPEENITYCKKDGNFTEQGKKPEQGARNDLRQIRDAIREGKTNYQLLEEFGDKVLRTYRAVDWARDAYDDGSKDRDWEMDVRIYWGNPASGKSRAVTEEFGNKHIYRKEVGKWWDCYKDQECILIDDFDPNHCHDLKYDFLLRLLDRYPMNLEIKGGHTKMRSKVIVLTSNFDPKDWFLDRDNKEAFFRRVKEIKKFEGGIEMANKQIDIFEGFDRRG